MRDPTLYTPEKCWTLEESDLAEKIVAAVRRDAIRPLDDIVAELRRTIPDTQHMDLDGAAAKMTQFPHIFEIADARNQLADYALTGKLRGPSTRELTHVRYRGWTVPLLELESFLQSGRLTPAMFEFFAKLMIPYLPNATELRLSLIHI